jgi:hypothetical protein
VPRRIFVVLLTLAVLAGGWLAYDTTRPPDFHPYRVTAVEAARAAHDGLLVAGLTAGAFLEGRALSPYVSTVLDDAGESVADASARFAELAPTDERTVAIRDELTPLLAEAIVRLGDVRRADANGDAGALREAIRPLTPLAERFAGFLDRHG